MTLHHTPSLASSYDTRFFDSQAIFLHQAGHFAGGIFEASSASCSL